MVHMHCRGATRTMMMTGDYHYTAIAVVQGVAMIPTGARVVIVQSQAEFQPPIRNHGAITSVLKRSKSLSPASHKTRAVSFCNTTSEQNATGKGLKFVLDNGDPFEDGDMLRALTSIAQVLLPTHNDVFANQH